MWNMWHGTRVAKVNARVMECACHGMRGMERACHETECV